MYGLDTVECYHPSLDTWIPVAKMRVHRKGVRVGVLDGVLYAVGGLNESCTLSSVETYRPSTGIWTPIADMHFPRSRPGNFSWNNSKFFFKYIEFKLIFQYRSSCVKWFIVCHRWTQRKFFFGFRRMLLP